MLLRATVLQLNRLARCLELPFPYPRSVFVTRSTTISALDLTGMAMEMPTEVVTEMVGCREGEVAVQSWKVWLSSHPPLPPLTPASAPKLLQRHRRCRFGDRGRVSRNVPLVISWNILRGGARLWSDVDCGGGTAIAGAPFAPPHSARLRQISLFRVLLFIRMVVSTLVVAAGLVWRGEGGGSYMVVR